MSFIWNGVSSDTMKFNVTSRQVYNAPAYDLNAIEVPGRSGDLLNPQNRFKNKQITYTGFLKASDFEGSTWWEKLSTGLIQMKGWLCSDAGTYHELTDDYDPGFTRYGYISGETAISDVQDRPFGVTLTVTFNVKPFMYKAGEPMELPEVKSASGSIITITDGAENTPLKSAIVNIEPVQDLHGYDYPWPAGGGKNKLNVSSGTGTEMRGVNVTYDNAGGLTYSGTTAANGFIGNWTLSPALTLPAGTYTFSIGETISQRIDLLAGWTSVGYINADNTSNTFTLSEAKTIDKLVLNASKAGLTININVKKIQIESGSTATAYAPYSNICPISGWSEVNVWVKPTYDTTLTPTATIAFDRTVYGGTLDVVRGKLTIDRGYATITSFSKKNGATKNNIYENQTVRDLIAKPAADANVVDLLSNAFVKWNFGSTGGLYSNDKIGIAANVNGTLMIAVGKNGVSTLADANTWVAANPIQVVYPLATPLEYDVTPQTIKTLLGTNNIWADAGDMSIEYPIPTENPYPFGSRPLYEITMAGTGTLVVNGKEWTITNYTGTLYCDTEAMEWYDASQLRNNIVSGDGWPVFEAGENSVSYTGDITKVMVTPRWRTL